MKAPFLTLILLAGLLLCVPVAGVMALDWGGSITTTNNLQSVPEGSDDDAFDSTQKLVLYLTTDMGPNWEFVGQLGASLDSEPLFAADLEKLYVQRNRVFSPDNDQPGGLVGMTTRFGRFLISEPTGLVMSHPVDGAAFIVNYANFELYAGAGYTGLMNKEFSSVSLSLSDSVDDEDDDVYFGPGRLLGTLRLSVPEILLGQNVALALAVQEDLRNPDDVLQIDDISDDTTEEKAGGLLDTQYGILALDGPLGLPGLFYNASYVLNTGRTLSLVEDDAAREDAGKSYQYEQFLAHMVDFGVQYYLPRFFSSVFGAGVTYTTGDDDYSSFTEGNTKGNATQFTAVTPGAKGLVFALQPGNSTTTEVSYAMKPFDRSSMDVLSTLQTELSYFGFFRSSGKGFVSSSDVDAGANGSWLGSEVDLALRFRPFSDFGIGLSGGMFFANDAVMLDDTNSVDWIARLTASLSF
jgi:hypothetical protein